MCQGWDNIEPYVGVGGVLGRNQIIIYTILPYSILRGSVDLGFTSLRPSKSWLHRLKLANIAFSTHLVKLHFKLILLLFFIE
jgi:hypothetical protein